MADISLHLNRNNSSPLFSRLKRSIDESKQGKAAPAQWASMIKAMTSKGVKSMEIDESNILAWLDQQPAGQSITREALAKQLDSLMFTIKEVRLQSPKFGSHRQAGGLYGEYLYIGNSERDNIIDDLEAVEYEMEAVVFSPERLIDEPDLVMDLERRRTSLIELKGRAIDFTQHHFSGQITGRHGKNLLAHCRITERPKFGLYFIEEIQSDWAQRGRKNDWRDIPRGPLVTNTEAWAGMVLRRQLQIAATNPAYQHISWITESMRNGGHQNSAHEGAKIAQKKRYDEALKEDMTAALAVLDIDRLSPEAQAQAKSIARDSVIRGLAIKGISEPSDMLNEFYLKVIPRIVDKILVGTGSKVEIKTIKIDEDNTCEVPTITLTDKVRERLIDKQPVYSRALLMKQPIQQNDPVLISLVKAAGDMMGTTKHLRLVTHLYDISTGARIAGRFINHMVQVSLLAKHFDEVLNHECFHYAQEQLLTQKELRVVREAFAPGGALNEKVLEILTARGDFDLASQCMDPDEAAAQGFALWHTGQLDVQDAPVKGIFSDLVTAVKDVVRWVCKVVLQENYQSTQDVFEAFASGDFARRHEEELAEREKYRTMA